MWWCALTASAALAAAACTDPLHPLASPAVPRADASATASLPLSQLTGTTPGFTFSTYPGWTITTVGNTFTFPANGGTVTSPPVDARLPQGVVVDVGSPANTAASFEWVIARSASAGDAGIRFYVEPETGHFASYLQDGTFLGFLDPLLRYVQFTWEPGVGVHVAQSASPTGPFAPKVTGPIPAAFTSAVLASVALVLQSNGGPSLSLVPQGTPAAAKVLAFMGASAVPSAAAVQAQGGAFAKYESDFASFANYTWQNDGAANAGQAANFYDRAMIYYVWWARTGNGTYRMRADTLALNARAWLAGANPVPPGYDPNGSLSAAPYYPQAYQMMLDGVALHALVTGDTVSRYTVARVADNMASGYWYYTAGVAPSSGSEGDPRNSARVLNAILDAQLLQVKSPAGYDYAAKLRGLMASIVAGQDTSGAYRWAHAMCGYDKPFMDGMLNDALIRYYTSFEQDARIPVAVKKSVDFLWAHEWYPATSDFAYLEASCPTSGESGGTPDANETNLNNLIASGYQFVARQTGDASYQAKADAVFAGGVNGAYLYYDKEFNQEYTASYRYLALRSGTGPVTFQPVQLNRALRLAPALASRNGHGRW